MANAAQGPSGSGAGNEKKLSSWEQAKADTAAADAAKLAERLKDPDFAEKYAAKAAKQAEFEAKMLAEKERKEALKALSPEERAAAKKQKRDEDWDRIAAETTAKEEAKLAERLKDPDFAEKYAAKAAKRAANEAAMAKREQEKAELAAKIGKKIADEFFAMKRVRLYENGYVEVGLGLASSPEKLVSISADAEVTKKTGLGRAAAAVLTNGVNLLSPNRRGDLTLTIQTDVDSRVLHTDNPTNEDMKAMKKLEATGNAILTRLEALNAPSASSSSSVSADVSEQLSKLADLKSQGLLDDAEFAAAKAKLLGL